MGGLGWGWGCGGCVCEEVVSLGGGSGRRRVSSVFIVVVVVALVGMVIVVVAIYVADAGEVGPDPASGAFEPHFSPFLEIVHAAAGEEDDAGWGVGFILLEVEVEAETDYADELEEVDVEVVWLGTVGLPEEVCVGMPELGY